jgi:hypothetical protein
MTRFAVPLHDLDLLWRTPAGTALVEATLDDQDGGDVVTVHGRDAIVLTGPAPRVGALVASFLVAAAVAAPSAPTVRVFANDGRGWRRVTAAPAVPDLPDEQPVFEDADLEEALAHA